jgi:hypothetical protein
MAKKDIQTTSTGSDIDALARALQQAIEATRPPTPKNIFTRKKGSPWDPKDGTPKAKLKRKMYHHGLLIDEKRVSNEEIERLNKVRPGSYMDGNVQVIRRRDKGIDIRYSIKGQAQKVKLYGYGVRNFADLCERIIFEQSLPKKSEFDVESED